MAGAKCIPARPIPGDTGFRIILPDANGISGPGDIRTKAGKYPYIFRKQPAKECEFQPGRIYIDSPLAYIVYNLNTLIGFDAIC
ncbi:MAG: hypothetical protein ACXWWW_00740 [Candidatus Deferrimicrobiaceae bacterium]